MTENQLKYLTLMESQRHNAATEADATRRTDETIRSNRAGESLTATAQAETKRANLAREKETVRSNRADELEAVRSNTTREAEARRHNAATEAQAATDTGVKLAQSIFGLFGLGK